MTKETKDMPTDPLADASTGVVRRSRGAFLKTTPASRPDRRDALRKSREKGPERHEEEKPAEGEDEPKHIFGLPRWMIIAAGVYLAALALAMVLIFTY
jgi:hypothetical protein